MASGTKKAPTKKPAPGIAQLSKRVEELESTLDTMVWLWAEANWKSKQAKAEMLRRQLAKNPEAREMLEAALNGS